LRIEPAKFKSLLFLSAESRNQIFVLRLDFLKNRLLKASVKRSIAKVKRTKAHKGITSMIKLPERSFPNQGKIIKISDHRVIINIKAIGITV
jgi:hypothetical protein